MLPRTKDFDEKERTSTKKSSEHSGSAGRERDRERGDRGDRDRERDRERRTSGGSGGATRWGGSGAAGTASGRFADKRSQPEPRGFDGAPPPSHRAYRPDRGPRIHDKRRY